MSRMKSAALLMLGSAMLAGSTNLPDPIPYKSMHYDEKPSSLWNNTKLKYHHNRTLNQRQRRKLERQMNRKRN